MDVFYVLGTGSKWNNNELRYSLRSIEKHLKNVDRVFVTGSDPHFLSDKVVFTPCNDIGIFAVNHYHKVKTTFEKTNISDDALYMMDDIFFLQDMDSNNYPYFFKANEIPAQFSVDKLYDRNLKKTREVLLSENKPIKSFEVHSPITYNRNKFLSLNWDSYRIYDEFIAPRSYYCNTYNIQGEYRKDCKIRKLDNSLYKFDDIVAGLDCFSIADSSLFCGMKEILEKLYPNKSKWEK